MLLPILTVRNWLEAKRLRSLFWEDTREMLADGLTKGGVDRTLLNGACESDYYKLKLGNHVRCTRVRAGALEGGD